jgi:hypothetical protein
LKKLGFLPHFRKFFEKNLVSCLILESFLKKLGFLPHFRKFFEKTWFLASLKS